MKYAEVILPLSLDGTFTYEIPESMEGKVKEGMRVLVPLGKSRHYLAIVDRITNEKPNFELKPIAAIADEEPVLLPVQLKMWHWIADYYMCNLGEVYISAMPTGLKAAGKYKPKTETYVALTEPYRKEQALHVALQMLGHSPAQAKLLACYLNISHWDTLEGDTPAEPILEITRDELMNESSCSSATLNQLIRRQMLRQYEKEVGRLNDAICPSPENIKPLSTAQQDAYNQILLRWMKTPVVLLHGVTSSGKTEIYIHLIQQALERHEQVLYLLPEIALTVQIMERLRRVLGSRLGIYHSKYSDAERVEIWRKQLSASPYDVILGARSAVFLPFQRLGLVIIDEEHETSFKQQDPAPRYHARSLAIMLARWQQAKVLLGTATPSLESYHNAETGKYGLVTLTHRYRDVQLPEIEVVDTKDLRHRKMMSGPFSPRLLAAVREALQNGKQAILFQNRRGYAPRVECKECGWVPKCENCDVSLTYHKNTNILTCHYCGAVYQVPTKCPNCGSQNIIGRGYGTEKIEDEISEILPEARIARMDLDTTRSRGAYARIIDEFSSGRANLLVGTQMVTKGLDFDNVAVVGILDADAMMLQPDFRAYEHAFQMMSQVSGRAGRRGERGQVILQTRDAQSPLIRQVVAHDYGAFYQLQMEERQMFNYPPFRRLIYIYLKHKYDAVVDHAAQDMARQLRQWFGDRLLGPDKPSVARVKNLSIRRMVLKIEPGLDQRLVRQYLRAAQQLLMQQKPYALLQVFYDVDPE